MKSLSIRLLLLAAAMLVATTAAFATGPAEEMSGSNEVTFSWWALSGGGGSPNPRETVRQAMIADFGMVAGSMPIVSPSGFATL